MSALCPLDVCFQAILGVLYLQWTKKSVTGQSERGEQDIEKEEKASQSNSKIYRKQAVSLGICKVNIFTDIDKAGKAGIEKGLAAGAKTNIFPFTTYFIPFATDLKYVSSACCIIQSSKLTIAK